MVSLFRYKSLFSLWLKTCLRWEFPFFWITSIGYFPDCIFFISAVAGFLNGLAATYFTTLLSLSIPVLLKNNFSKYFHWHPTVFSVCRVLLKLFFLLMYGVAYQESLYLAENLFFSYFPFSVKKRFSSIS
jgi:hypothetical protein